MVVLEGKLHLALILSGALLELLDVNVVRGNAVELFRGEPDLALLLVEVLLSLDTELAQALLDLLETISLGAGRKLETVLDVALVVLLQDVELFGL